MEPLVKELLKNHQKDKDLEGPEVQQEVKKLRKKYNKIDKKLRRGDEQLFGLDWSGADLKGFYLGNLKLSTKKKPANFRDVIFTNAHLIKAELRFACLEGANLSQANLKYADLMGSNLKRADLSDANLQEADLVKTHLDGANLSYVHLEKTHLDDAHLEGACLSSAHVKETDFMNAYLEGAILHGTNFEDAKNFEFTYFSRIDEEIVFFALPVYIRLVRFFRYKGRNNRAGEFYFRKKVIERRKYFGEGKYLLWLLSHLFSKLCGYGEHVWKIVAIIFGILILFTGVYYFGDGIARNDDFSYGASISGCGYFSVVTFTTLGFGDYEPKPHFQGFAAIEALLGYFMLSLFVITLARKVMR